MTYEFELGDGTDVASMLERAREHAKGVGIALAGDAESGRFQGTAEGTYVVDGSSLKVEVTDKPGFVPWPMIESALRKVFA